MPRSRFYPFDLLIRYASPWALLASALTYVLGCGLSNFLGGMIEYDLFYVGLLAVLMLQTSSYWLKAYYDSFEPDQRFVPPPRLRLQRDSDEARALPRGFLLVASITTLTVGAVLTVMLFRAGVMHAEAVIIMGVTFLAAFFYAVPPVRLSQTGYGDLVQAIVISNLIPALAFLFQAKELHRLLPILTFPLTAIFLAMVVAVSLQSYAEDVRIGRRTLVALLGWQRSMNLHNILIVAAYLLVGLAALLGQPWSLTWPELLCLPIGAFQVITIIQIAGGAKPRWHILNLTAVAHFGLLTYLITFALWTG